jgi:hypothetical protein
VQRAVHQGFKHLGPTFLPRVSHPSQFPTAMSVAVRRAVAQLTQGLPAGGRWMIVEDGGYAFPALHDEPTLRPHLAACLGAVEHTTRGKLNDQYQEIDAAPTVPRQLQRPAVTIAGSRLKTAHEGGFVAQALVDECGFLLRKDHQFLRYRPVVVVGYGRIGRALARALANLDAQVMVADPNLAATDAAHQVTTLAEALCSGVFLVFGATGIPSMTPAQLGMFLRERDSDQDTLYLASASSKQIEFSQIFAFFQQARTEPALLRETAGREGRVLCELDPGVGLRYRVEFADGTSKTCVLLAHGYPVIFFPPDTHGAPNRAMDPVMTQLLLAACGLPHGHASLDRRVHTLDDLRELAGAPPAVAGAGGRGRAAATLVSQQPARPRPLPAPDRLPRARGPPRRRIGAHSSGWRRGTPGMTAVVWITGRAATGKSTLLAACLARLRQAGHDPLRLCDEELLFQLKHADTTHAHHYHPYGDRRFLFRDGYLFDEGLRRIGAAVLAVLAGSPAYVLIELARGSAAPPVDLTWRHALDLIHPRIWPHSLVFRLDAPVQVQLDRNRQRTTDGQPHTPEQILHSLYAQDDHDSLIRAGIAVQPIPHTLPPGQAAWLVINTLDRALHVPAALP